MPACLRSCAPPAPLPLPLLALNFYGGIFFSISIFLSLSLFFNLVSCRTISRFPGLRTSGRAVRPRSAQLSWYFRRRRGHTSGQLTLAPRRSSRSDFARASFAHSSTQVRNVTAHSAAGCETRRTPSPLGETGMAHAASALRGPAPRPRPRRRPGPCSALGANLEARAREGVRARAGGAADAPASPGQPQPAEGRQHVPLRSRSSSATGSKWEDGKPYTTSSPERSERS